MQTSPTSAPPTPTNGVPLEQLKPLWSAGLVLALFLLPLYLWREDMIFELNFLTGMLIWGLLALSLDLVWGYGGMISLGQGVFFGAGGYAMAWFLTGGITHRVGRAPDPELFAPLFGLGVGIALAVVLALGIAFLCFRSRVGGLFFAVVTLALAVTAKLLVITWRPVTGGDNGIINIPRLFRVDPEPELIQYFIVLTAVLAAYWICRRLVASHFGRVLTAIRENELRASSIGFNVNLAKTLIFGVAAAIAALAGALFAPYNGNVNPIHIGFETGAIVLIWVAIGGRGFLLGAFIGTFLVQYVRFYMTDFIAPFMSVTTANSVWPLIFGFVFLGVILLYPDGMMGLLHRIGAWRVPLPEPLRRALVRANGADALPRPGDIEGARRPPSGSAP